MTDSNSGDILTKIQEIKTRLTDQSANGLVTRAYLDQKLKTSPEKKSEEKPPPSILEQFFEVTGLKPVIDAFKSGGWLAGAGAILAAVGVKLIDFEVLFSGIRARTGPAELRSCSREPAPTVSPPSVAYPVSRSSRRPAARPRSCRNSTRRQRN